MKTFQQPLSAEEEACCIKHMQEEGSERAREARALLIERNLRLVAHIAKKYQNLDEDMEDLISIGTIGLIKAVNTFDAAKKIRLSSYASKCIENELLMMIRGRKKKSKEVSLYEPIGTDKEGNEISLLDIIENEQTDILESMERRRNTKKLGELLYTRLDDREREIICMRYGILLPGKPENGGCLPVLIGCSDEVTQREIGAMLGISRSYPAVIIGIKIQSPCKERPGMPSVGMPGLLFFHRKVHPMKEKGCAASRAEQKQRFCSFHRKVHPMKEKGCAASRAEQKQRFCSFHRKVRGSHLICKQQYPIFIASAYAHIFVTLILEFVSVAAV